MRCCVQNIHEVTELEVRDARRPTPQVRNSSSPASFVRRNSTHTYPVRSFSSTPSSISQVSAVCARPVAFIR